MTDRGDAHSGERFEVATGGGPLPPPVDPRERAAAVQAAFDGLRQIRRTVNTAAADPLATPAAWERQRPVRAVALALEAAGLAPSRLDADGQRVATGYCVAEADRPGGVRVAWLGGRGSGAQYEEREALDRCATVLRALGWEALLYRGAGRRHHLEVEPGG